MIFMTGGAGYIGSHTIKMLGYNGYKMIAYDNLSQGRREMVNGCELIEGDLSDKKRLVQIFKDYSISTVFHFAASNLIGESEENPHKYYENNVMNSINLVGAMLDAGVKNIVYSSSAAVYGEPVRIPIEENHPTCPTNVYGMTKLIIESLLNKYSEVYGLRYISLRYFNAAGADPSGMIGEDHTPETHLIPIILNSIMGHCKEITILGTDYDTPDGTCIRDYIHVNDLAHAHILCLNYLENLGFSAVFNLGNGSGFSVREVIQSVEKVTGKRVPFTLGQRRKGDPARLVASSKKVNYHRPCRWHLRIRQDFGQYPSPRLIRIETTILKYCSPTMLAHLRCGASAPTPHH